MRGPNPADAWGLRIPSNENDESAHRLARAIRPTEEEKADMTGRRIDQQDYEGVYIISVAARILEMHPQTLRKYERIGLVRPSRTVGMLRLYSEEDVARLRLIKHLVVNLGLNLAGVQLAVQIFNQMIHMKDLLRTLEGDNLKVSLDQDMNEVLELLQGTLR